MGRYVLVPNGKDLKQLTTDEIQKWLSCLANTEIIRSILYAEIHAIRAGYPREIRTLRGVWYEIVKPVLSRLGVLNNRTSTGEPVDWDKYLSEILVTLVNQDVTSYEELKIIDGSRQRFSAQAITAQMIDVTMVGGHCPWVILFAEKDTIWPVISNLASFYGVSAISGGGQPSNSCSENITREIIRSKTYQAAKPERIIVLTLTDYDPAGYSISEAQINQILKAANNMTEDELGNLKTVYSVRLGVTPDQLTAEEIEANAYEPKDKGLEKWLKITGGINGRPLGLELDSLPLTRLRRMFAIEIEKHIDITRRSNDLKESYLDIMACNMLLPEFERKRAELIKTAKESEIWRDISQVLVPDDLFIDAAVNGHYWISPKDTAALFSDYQDRLTRLWQDNLGNN